MCFKKQYIYFCWAWSYVGNWLPVIKSDSSIAYIREVKRILLNFIHNGFAFFFSQRLSVQEVPPLLNGDSSSRSQQQRSAPSENLSQSLPGLSPSSSPHPQPNSNGHTQSNASASPQQVSLQSVVSVTGLHTSPSSYSSLQGFTPPLTAPHSPPLPHSAPLSRALTPVPSNPLQGVVNSPSAFNLLKGAEVYSTSTLPLPRRQPSETRTGFFGERVFLLQESHEEKSGFTVIFKYNIFSIFICFA